MTKLQRAARSRQRTQGWKWVVVVLVGLLAITVSGAIQNLK